MSARHLAWLRTLPCVVSGCSNPRIEAHHIRTAANSGMGMKPDNRFAVPCCFEHHREYHNHGRKTFERKYGLELLAEAERYAASSGQDALV
jgi:hypothetical protein